MNKWLKMIKMKAILPAAALLAAAAIGTTFAWQSWNLDVTNELKAHTTEVTVREDFQDWTQKEVAFQNTGDSSVFLRVSYSDYWETTEEPRQLLSGKDNAGKNIGAPVWTDAWESDWCDGGDGWYYYKKILTKGEITESVIEGVNYIDLPEGYDTKYYHLFFKAEVVQCSDGSNTLNSREVNAQATYDVFERIAVVEDDGSVKWYNRNASVEKPDVDLPDDIDAYLESMGK